jgi:hypothetical protein
MSDCLSVPHAAPSAKGCGLHSWQEGQGWYFTLITGTHRLNGYKEIDNYPDLRVDQNATAQWPGCGQTIGRYCVYHTRGSALRSKLSSWKAEFVISTIERIAAQRLETRTAS